MIIMWTNMMAWNFYAELWIGVGKDVQHAQDTGSASGGLLGMITGGGSGAAGKTFDQIDTNHDNVIDKNEAAAAGISAAQFNAMDKNHDGVISRAEFNGQQQQAHGGQQQQST